MNPYSLPGLFLFLQGIRVRGPLCNGVVDFHVRKEEILG